MNTPGFNIAAVERDTGLSKDVLRVWERRYGFPVPDRDANGERLYPAEQVARLRLIKRLMDQGHRPGKLIAAPAEELTALAPRRSRHVEKTPPADAKGLAELLTLIKQHDAAGYLQAMQQSLARQGLQRFVQDTVAPLTRQVGEAWENGSVEVFEEHLFTELTKRLLRQAIAALPGGTRNPRVLLTTFTQEAHGLGRVPSAVDAAPWSEVEPLMENPANREALLAALRRYPLEKGRKITFEYILMKGVNDSEKNAHELARLLSRVRAKINLIPFNEWPGAPYKRSSGNRIHAFADIIYKAGYASPIRTPRGEDIMAACGQLKSDSVRKRKSERQPLPA